MKLSKLIIADWTTSLRKVDPFVVSRYRIAMRSGAKFPPVIYDTKTMEIICGNHRASAYNLEFGNDYDIPAEGRSFKSMADKLILFAKDNATHGEPLDSYSRKKIALAMSEAGLSSEKIAKTFNVPVQSVEKWGGETVFVIGAGPKVAKKNIDTKIINRITPEQYEAHTKHDRAISIRHLAAQITRHLLAGWIPNDEETICALVDLRSALDKHEVLARAS